MVVQVKLWQQVEGEWTGVNPTLWACSWAEELRFVNVVNPPLPVPPEGQAELREVGADRGETGERESEIV